MSTNVPIASQTLGSNASSVTFSDIPQSYTDLILVIWSKPYTNSEGSLKMTFNSDGGSNYSNTGLFGDGTSASSGRNSNVTSIALSSGNALNNPRQPMFIIQIMNYSNTTTYKTSLIRTAEGGSSAGYLDAWVGMWRSTAAITSLTIGLTYIFDIGAGSTFNLYGINAANSAQAKATGGDTIVRDASYWYHVFNKSGTFTPTQALTADYLVVAGGGGGSQGGGGAGGFRTSIGGSALSLTAQAYAVTVGAGGTGSTTTIGANGSDSIFSTITSTGGGGGGTYSNTSSLYNGQNGGSGGGGGFTANGDGTTTSGGTPSSGQGNNGGTGRHVTGLWLAGGGGGGASATGGNAVNSGGTGIGGSGGNGTANSITGSSVTYSGGGGGRCQQSPNTAAGGSGGGGTGGNDSVSGANGTASTGGGGGGGSIGVGNGGSGIVIVRYPV